MTLFTPEENQKIQEAFERKTCNKFCSLCSGSLVPAEGPVAIMLPDQLPDGKWGTGSTFMKALVLRCRGCCQMLFFPLRGFLDE